MCLCADNSHQARKICPPLRIWPIIQERGPPGELAPPLPQDAIPTESPNLHLLRSDSPTVLSILLWTSVSAQLRSCSRRATPLRSLRDQVAGGSPVFRNYDDIEMGDAFRISRRLISLIDSDSSGGDRNARGDNPRRRNWRGRAAARKSDTSPVSPTPSGTPMKFHWGSSCVGCSGGHPSFSEYENYQTSRIIEIIPRDAREGF